MDHQLGKGDEIAFLRASLRAKPLRPGGLSHPRRRCGPRRPSASPPRVPSRRGLSSTSPLVGDAKDGWETRCPLLPLAWCAGLRRWRLPFSFPCRGLEISRLWSRALIFPLPLTPFEYYYWCDDRPGYPTACPSELEFTGVMDQECFADAWQTALARHPLLRARIDDSQKWPAWQTGDCPLPEVDWATAEKPIVDDLCQPIDLASGSGLRAWVRVSDTSTRLRLRIHHACCDGLGGIRFLEDLLLGYAQRYHRRAGPLLPAVDEQLLQHRAEVGFLLGQDTPHYRLTPRDVCQTAIHWARFLARRSLPLAAPAGVAQPPWPYLDERGFLTRPLDDPVEKRLRQIARSARATFNDLLLRDLLQVVQAWNRRHHPTARGWMRVNLPVNLRVTADQALPATNRLSFAFLSRRARDCVDGQQLLESIRAETRSVLENHSSLCFLGGLGFASGIRGMLPRFLDGKRCMATIVLSNLGRVFGRTRLPRRDRRLVCGNVTLETIGGVPPIRPLTRGAIVVAKYAGEVSIHFRYDPHCFDPSQGEAFLDAYVAQLRETSGG